MQQIYTKKGNKNYKEKPLIDQIKKELLANPSLDGKYPAANTFEELKALHLKICATDVDFTETKREDQEPLEEDFEENTTNSNEDDDFIPENIVDPLTADEPVVRDYVLDNTFDNPDTQTQETTQTHFDEPVNWTEAFEMPENSEEEGPVQAKANNENKGAGAGSKKINVPPSSGSSNEKKSTTGSGTFNSDADGSDPAQKRKQTRKMAKYLVDTFCMLLEKGFVWFSTKDIDENVLSQLESEGEIDLSLMLTLTNEQEIVARDFFQNQRMEAEAASKIDPEEKADLAAALAEVMLEKNIAITPSQQLALVGLKIVGMQFVKAWMLSKTNQMVVDAIRVKNNHYHSEAPSQQPAQSPEPGNEEGTFEQPTPTGVATEDLLLGEGEIETKE